MSDYIILDEEEVPGARHSKDPSACNAVNTSFKHIRYETCTTVTLRYVTLHACDQAFHCTMLFIRGISISLMTIILWDFTEEFCAIHNTPNIFKLAEYLRRKHFKCISLWKHKHYPCCKYFSYRKFTHARVTKLNPRLNRSKVINNCSSNENL